MKTFMFVPSALLAMKCQLAMVGCDCRRRADGGLTIKGPPEMVRALGPRLRTINKAALRAEMDRLDRESTARLRALLPHRARGSAA